MIAESTTEVGSYFIANYPPFSLWDSVHVPKVRQALASPADVSVPMGLYIHIPFCRKRCRFCYFRVYTNQNAQAIENYVQALEKEFHLLSQQPGVQGRTLRFAYFGGGTPSYLSAKQLRSLHDRLSEYLSWQTAEEVTFECEPGTLSLEKVKMLKEIGVTRVSLGVENFNDEILETNGRAHLSPEIFRAYDWLQQVGFPQINVDLIAGMVGETEENWANCVERVKQMEPDNITIYQMELPFNTVIAREMKEQGITSPVAGWETKRRWVSEAMDTLFQAGYHISSGNELVRSLDTDHFVYRDHLFRGSDILATGVSSFGHFQGVPLPEFDQIEQYMSGVGLGRAADPSRFGSDPASEAHSRDGSAAQRGTNFGPPLSSQIRRRYSPGIRRTAAKPAGGRLSRRRGGRNPPHPPRPAPGRHVVARVFREGTSGSPLHLRFPPLAPLPTGNP